MTTESRRAAFELAIRKKSTFAESESAMLRDPYGEYYSRVLEGAWIAYNSALDGVAAPAMFGKQEPLGAEFEKVLDDNFSQLVARWDSAPAPQQEVVERAAENVYGEHSDHDHLGNLIPWERASPQRKEIMRRRAKAALSALPQQRVWTHEEIVGIIYDCGLNDAYALTDALIAEGVVNVGE
jgi:hypothetical protein